MGSICVGILFCCVSSSWGCYGVGSIVGRNGRACHVTWVGCYLVALVLEIFGITIAFEFVHHVRISIPR